MAWMPCLSCGQRFAGEALNAYLTIWWGDEREAYRFVVCPECLEALAELWRQQALYRDADGSWTYREPGEAVQRLSGPIGEPPEPRGRSKRPGGPRSKKTRPVGPPSAASPHKLASLPNNE